MRPAGFLLAALFAFSAQARDYIVSPAGSNGNLGTEAEPMSLRQAAELLRPGDRCFLRGGIYRETFRPSSSGEEGAPIVVANFADEVAVISGADLIEGWEPDETAISAAMPWSLRDGNQVFVDGEMIHEASWPAFGDAGVLHPRRARATGGSATTLVDPSLPDICLGTQLWCAGGAAWICWTANVTAYDPDANTLTFDKAQGPRYAPRAGNAYMLRGTRGLLAPGQWCYDDARQRLVLQAESPPERAEAKRRKDAIDLSGRAHIHVRGLHLHAAGIRSDPSTSDIVLDGLRARFVSHSYTRDTATDSGILIHGRNILVLNCDLAYSSASVLSVTGEDNRIINCLIQHGGYAGLWRGTVSLAGRRQVFSHNTVCHAGRDLINTHGLMESIVQYNDVSDAGWLTRDLGMFYGHNTDFANTVFRYNMVHDNRAEHVAMGIYFDHLSHNAIVHHNQVWNVGMDPIRFNNPSYNNLIFDNRCWRTGKVRTFDHSRREDLFACRFTGNVFNNAIQLPADVHLAENQIIAAPLDEPGIDGAGCDLRNPPTPLPEYAPPRIWWMNVLHNAAFEFGSLEGWKRRGAEHAKLVTGNGWGNGWGREATQPTGTSKYELRLGPGEDAIAQTVSGLSPNTRHQLSAWVRAASGETVILSIAGKQAVSRAQQWTRLSLDFLAGPDGRAICEVRKSAGPGYVWCDNLTLPLVPGP
jgi:hypothetical protein